MLGYPILKARSLLQHFVELVVADFADTLRGADTRLLHRLAQHLRYRSISLTARPSGQSGTLPRFNGRHDTTSGRLAVN